MKSFFKNLPFFLLVTGLSAFLYAPLVGFFFPIWIGFGCELGSNKALWISGAGFAVIGAVVLDACWVLANGKRASPSAV